VSGPAARAKEGAARAGALIVCARAHACVRACVRACGPLTLTSPLSLALSLSLPPSPSLRRDGVRERRLRPLRAVLRAPGDDIRLLRRVQGRAHRLHVRACAHAYVRACAVFVCACLCLCLRLCLCLSVSVSVCVPHAADCLHSSNTSPSIHPMPLTAPPGHPRCTPAAAVHASTCTYKCTHTLKCASVHISASV
jgi:hypothetical protein